MKKIQLLLAFALLALTPCLLQAQDLKNMKADRFFSGSLTKVLDEIINSNSPLTAKH
jgi:hypothetical protein